MKLLIIEDEQALAEVLREEFESQGIEVTAAADGEAALKAMEAGVPEAVLLDLLLPKKDGFEVLAAMKASAALKRVPVVILSNLAQSDDVKRGLALGADGYLIKTDFSLKEVVDQVRKLVGAKRR